MKKKMSIVINNKKIENEAEYRKHREDIERQRVENERLAAEKRRIKEENKRKLEEEKKAEEERKKQRALEIKRQQEENKKRKQEQMQQIFAEHRQILNSYSTIEMVDEVGRYRLCERCDGENKMGKLRIYSEKKETAVRICDNCSKITFQCSYESEIPADIFDKVTMDADMQSIYERVVLKKRLKADKCYLMSNMDTPIHVRFSDHYCGYCGIICGHPIKQQMRAFDKEKQEFTMVGTEVYLCCRCGRFQLSESEFYRLNKKYILFQNFHDQNGHSLRSVDMKTFEENLQNTEKSIAFSLDRDSKALVRSSDGLCTVDRHELIDIEGIVTVMNPEGGIVEVRVPVAKCMACSRYYIHEEKYKELKKIGIIMCRIEDRKSTLQNWTGGFSDWNQESILHMYGYNVSSTANLTEEQRHTILRMLVERRILSRFSIIDHLEFLINLNKDKTGFGVAVRKWQNDIGYLNNLELNAVLEEVNVMKVVKHLNWIHK